MTLVSSCSVCKIPNRNHHESIASYIDLGSQVPARSRSFQVLCLERRFKKEDDVYTGKRSWSRVSRTQVPDVISILRQNTARTWPRESQSLAFSQGFPGQCLQWRSSIRSSPEEDWSHGMRTAILLHGNSSLTALQSRLSTRFSKAGGQTRLPSVEFQQEIVEEECQYCRSDSL